MLLSRSSIPVTDPLSDVLITLGSDAATGSRLEAAGAWSLCFPALNRLKFVALRRGRCCILLPGQAPEWLSAGDVILLGRTDYVVASDPSVPPVSGTSIYPGDGSGSVRLGGDDVVLVGASVQLTDAAAGFLLDALPVFLRPGAPPSAVAVSSVLDLLDIELQANRPGRSLVTMRLAEVLLVEAVRAYAADAGPHSVGWIGALGDKRIGAALTLMHGSVDHPWTVPVLAERVGMSRSAFSARFTARVGRPPLDYLRFWRMVLARQLLAQGRGSVEQIAHRVGYASQSAFAFAFRNTFGQSPRRSAGGSRVIQNHTPVRVRSRDGSLVTKGDRSGQ